MSDREGSRSPPNHKQMNDRDRDRDRSPHDRRDESPRNHKTKSYSRTPSPSRSRKMSYREGGDRDRERRRDDRDRDRSRRRHTGTRDNPKPSRCLGVFGLSVYTTQEELYHIMSKYGPVERVQVVIDAKTGRSRGFSFVYFESIEDAKAAKEQCTGMKINGKNIRVDYSITERAHTPTPGIYMGKPTYVPNDKWDRRGRERDRDDYYGGYRSKYHRRSPSPHYRRRRYDRSRSRSYSPRLRIRDIG